MPMPPESETRGRAWQALLEPLRAEPARAAILTDVDGTLAPIVERAEDAAVPARGARSCCAALSERYGLVGCVSGRRAVEARRLVGLDEIAYAGNHGLELLLPGEERAAPRSLAGRARARGGRVPRRPRRRPSSTGPGCGSRTRARSRRCTGAAPRTSAAAEARAHEIAVDAGRAGLEPRWGRKVLELRPVGGGGKGRRRRRRCSPPTASTAPSTPATTAPTSTPSAGSRELREAASWRRGLRRRRSRRRRRRSWPKSLT